MEILITFLVFFFTLALFQTIHLLARGNKASPKNLPKGPTPLPVIGNLLQLGDKPHRSLANLAKIYGPVMTLKLGQMITIVVSSPTLAREFLQTHDLIFADRTLIDAVYACQHYQVSIAWSPLGDLWRNLRKICNSYLFSNQKLDANQDLRLKKIQELIDDVQECCREGKPIDIGEAAFKTTLNSLSNTIFSLDLADSSSNKLGEFKDVVRGIMEEAGKPNLSDYFPVLRKIDLQGIRRRMTILFKRILDLFDNLIDERLELRKKQGYIRANDMLDTLLDLNDGNSVEIDKNCIKHLFLVLFVAGNDTTSSTLEWAMTELLRKPDTLLKARAEIEKNIGSNSRALQESDIVKLPYLKAIMKETFRLHPSVPLLLPRKAREDVEINGFTIPKDAQVFVNVWAIGRDPSLWEDPELFRPERFLDSDVDVRGRNFELIPFGAGRRICPGLPLGLRMLHLALASLIKNFDWKLEDGVTPESLDVDDKFGLSLQKAKPLLAVPCQLNNVNF